MGFVAPFIPAIIGAAGTGASAAGGKKGNNLASQQLQLQKDQFGLLQKQFNFGNSAWQPAANYFKSLLQGGQAAVQATGPYASLIGQNAQGARNSIQALLPQGGERNLALANSFTGQQNDIARLYAGMQPLAAQGLGQLAGSMFGSGAAVNPGSNIGAAAGIYNQNLQNAMAGAGGLGSLIYQGRQKKAANNAPSAPGAGGIGAGGNGPY